MFKRLKYMSSYWWIVSGISILGISSAGISIFLLYQAAYVQTQKELHQTATMLSSLIQAVAEFDIENSADASPLGSWGATMSQVEHSLELFQTTKDSARLVVGIKQQDTIILTHFNSESDSLDKTLVSIDENQPDSAINYAVGKLSGYGVFIDHSNTEILAGYSYVPALDIGLVYELPVTAVRKPYIDAAILSSIFVISFSFAGIVYFFRFIQPIQSQAKRDQQKILKQQLALEEAQRISRTGSWELDLVNNVLLWSDEIFRIFEIDKTMFGASYDAFLDAIHPDDRSLVDSAYKNSLATQQPYTIIHRLLMKDGRVKYVNESCETYFDNDGTPLQSIGTVQDITELQKTRLELEQYQNDLKSLVEERTIELEYANKHLYESLYELKLAQEQLVQSEKMASLGGLVAGVAHEINTPVGIGITAITHLQSKIDHYQDLYSDGKLSKSDFENLLGLCHQSASIIYSNLKRAADLINSFKKVAVYQSSDELKDFSLNEYIQEILTSIQPTLKQANIDIEFCSPSQISMTSFPGAIYQIITNLVMNSIIHAFEDYESGKIQISIETVETDFIKITYTDFGKGMRQDTINQIFEPFFTTKRGKGGSGLGMHIVFNLVTQSLSGTISCHSIEGSETTFIIKIPRWLSLDKSS